VNVFGTNFEPNTLTFIDQFLLIFWDGGSTISIRLVLIIKSRWASSSD